VGIDLGTTHTLVAWTDPARPASPEIFEVPELVTSGEVEARPLLPSFLYAPLAGEVHADLWDDAPWVIGELARRRGQEVPGRLVSSSKSWLCHPGVDRTAAILPWGSGDADVPRTSPVEASARLLRHLRRAWNDAFPQSLLEEQQVVLTVPASFDQAARELTLRAAHDAGLAVRLLEEPQAAFYAWLESQGDGWRERVTVGDLVLVCDVGGGTTDFSLIAVSEEDGALALRRVAVGDHILLGGDNMDLALARLAEQKLGAAGHPIDNWQLQQLWHQCRLAKERLLSDASVPAHPVTVLGRGARLIGGTLTTELTREDVLRVILDGFFPVVEAGARPQRQRRVGLQEIGLPYAADAAVTRHLARFLGEQARDSSPEAPIRRSASGFAAPTHVLFNGGVMKAPAVRARILEALAQWLASEGAEGLGEGAVLDAPDLDHAVARGAAYYGRARSGAGIRIRGGASRTYYIGIESSWPAVPGLPAPLKALCVVPFGMEEGTEAVIADREFGLVIGEPVEFRFLSSSLRKQDPIGALIEDWGDDLEELPPLEGTLTWPGRDDTVLPVFLESHVTEVGTLELWLVSRDRAHRWKLELNIRERRD
jgi:molecular chaperone DnaK (HSP70)